MAHGGDQKVPSTLSLNGNGQSENTMEGMDMSGDHTDSQNMEEMDMEGSSHSHGPVIEKPANP